MVDVLIVGGGPAALAAAVYLARQRVRLTMVAEIIGGQTLWSADVENYLGFHLLDGISLVKKFQEHLADYRDAMDLREGLRVTMLEKLERGYRAQLSDGSVVEARLVLVASGATHRTLNVPGEKTFYGKGVTYCATCDAPLFKDQRVVVIGGGNSAMDGALFAATYAREVLLVTVNKDLRGDAVMLKKVLTHPRIRVHAETRTTGILGETMVTGIQLQHAGVERIEPCTGVFIEIGLVPAAAYISFVAKDKWGQIIVDKYNATNVEGVWAAGDVTDVAEKQIAIAVGEGSKAALSIIKYLQTHE